MGLTSAQDYYASNIFYVIALGLVKCSVTCFVASLTVKDTGPSRHVPRKEKLALYGVLAACVGWMIGAAVVVGLLCPWMSAHTCMGTVWTAPFW